MNNRGIIIIVVVLLALYFYYSYSKTSAPIACSAIPCNSNKVVCLIAAQLNAINTIAKSGMQANNPTINCTSSPKISRLGGCCICIPLTAKDCNGDMPCGQGKCQGIAAGEPAPNNDCVCDGVSAVICDNISTCTDCSKPLCCHEGCFIPCCCGAIKKDYPREPGSGLALRGATEAAQSVSSTALCCDSSKYVIGVGYVKASDYCENTGYVKSCAYVYCQCKQITKINDCVICKDVILATNCENSPCFIDTSTDCDSAENDNIQYVCGFGYIDFCTYTLACADAAAYEDFDCPNFLGGNFFGCCCAYECYGGSC